MKLSLSLICISMAWLVNAQDVQPTGYEGIGITGDAADVTVPTELGIVLMGGSTDVDQALQWMIDRAKGGDVVIIRASGSTGYNEYIYGLGTVNSVETLLIDSREKALKESVGKRIREAEMLFIAGGDQWNYVKYWKDSEVSKAIKYLIEDKQIPIGGTSAGCAVLTGYIFDASHGSAYSKDVLKNPYDTTVSVSKSFIDLPFLKNAISDQHYSQRERQGRHVTFMARILKDMDTKQVIGIGVDEKTALCIDKNGNAFAYGRNLVYVLLAGPMKPEACKPDQSLTFDRSGKAIRAYIFNASPEGSQVYNLKESPSGRPTEFWFVKNGDLQRVKAD
ncbi:MAG: cyanophycinase [Cyclobacteriaceae bacterium]